MRRRRAKRALGRLAAPLAALPREPGSTLAASLAVRGDAVDSATATAAANARRRTAGGSGTWLTILPLGAHLELRRDAGWREQAPRQRAGRSAFVTARPGAAHSALT